MQNRRLSRQAAWLLSLMAMIALHPRGAWACAVCWGADDALAHGLNVSIAFLMSMPFLIGGSIIGLLYLAQRRAQGQGWPALLTKTLGRTQKEETQP